MFTLQALGNSNDMSTAKALTMCTKYVLKPYNAFLKVVCYLSIYPLIYPSIH